MKRACAVLLILFACFKTEAQVKWSVFAGPQATTATYIIWSDKQPTGFKYGFMAGTGLKVPFDNQLYFFPSVYYSLKGYKVTLERPSFPPSEFAKNNNTTIHTVEISPLFHIDLSKKPSHLFVRFGPAVDVVLSGKEKFDAVDGNGAAIKVDRPMVFSFGDYGRFTASGNIHFGYESEKRWMLFGYYAHGKGSMNNADGGPRIFHRVAGLSFGWTLGGESP